VLRRLEGQVLNGDGAGANMRGILQTSGLGAVTFTAGALIADQILKGITTVYLADAEATGVVLHPTDWQTALLAKSPKARPAGTATTSAAARSRSPRSRCGASRSSRRSPSRRAPRWSATSRSARSCSSARACRSCCPTTTDDFIENRVTMLAEMRAALPVFRPPAFATVALQ
jgi:hypothetical protein